MRFARLGPVAAVLASVLAATPGGAAKRDNSLRVASYQVLDIVDPYFNTSLIGIILGHQIWDTLIYRDPTTGEYKGQLATAWRQLDDKTIELDLRKGVTFHNGAAFDADDVVYTLELSSQAGNQGRPARGDVMDRSRGKGRPIQGADRHQAAVPGRDRVPRHLRLHLSA